MVAHELKKSEFTPILDGNSVKPRTDSYVLEDMGTSGSHQQKR